MRPRPLRYAIVLATLVAALAIRWVLDPALGDHVPFITLFGAVAFAVWLEGWRAAALAAAIGGLLCVYLFVEPRGAFGTGSVAAWAMAAGYTFSCGLIIALGEGMRSARKRYALAAQQASLNEAALRDSIAARARVEADLRFQKWALDASSIVSFTDVQGTITYANDKFCQISGCPAHEVVGANHRLVNSGFHPAEFFADMYRAIAQGQVWRGEIRNRRRDGSVYWVDTTIVPAMGPDGRPVQYVAISTDVTERKKNEDELRLHREELERLVEQRTAALEESHHKLRTSERMASLGTLSAGLGHDMGNLLVPIRIRLESLAVQPLSEQAREDVDALRTLADYLQRLTKGLRLLARAPEQSNRAETTDLRSWWREAEALMRSVLPTQVRLEAHLPAGECAVRKSRAALTQVVFNLVQNAGDALRERGHGVVSVIAAPDAQAVLVRVVDDGIGMTEDVRRRCMEPFFTTKTRGMATGLGLGLVYGLVRDAGGTVDLRSEPGKGTTFTLRLPGASPPPDDSSPNRSRGRAEVDIDDPRRRSFVVAELRALHFDVVPSLGAGSGVVVSVVDDAAKARRLPPDRRVILVGHTGESGCPNVRATGPDVTFATLRDVLHQFAADA